MENIPVYEYYDGYKHLWMLEDEKDRDRVQYVVLGTVEPDWVAICYTENILHIAKIGKGTHTKAWITKHISLEEAKIFIRKSYRKGDRTLDQYRKKYQALLDNPEGEDETG